jgi:hypothetical protein
MGVVSQRALMLLLGLALAACARAPEPEPAEGVDAGRAPEIACAPEDAVFGDTVVVRPIHPSGPYLAVRSPAGVLHLLAYPRGDHPAAPPPWIARHQLADTGGVRLPTAAVRATPWEALALQPELVFAEPGVYRITVAAAADPDAHGVPTASCELRVH